jgi:hypothetical protein
MIISKALTKLYHDGCIAFEKIEGNRTDRYSFWYDGTTVTRFLHVLILDENNRLQAHFDSNVSGYFELKSIVENSKFHECEPEADWVEYFDNLEVR